MKLTMPPEQQQAVLDQGSQAVAEQVMNAKIKQENATQMT